MGKVHYGVCDPKPYHIDNIRMACGQIYGKFTHYRPDVTCLNCRRTKAWKDKK